MTKNPLYLRLGAALRRARRDAGLTQFDIAVAAACSLPSVTAAEAGQGGSGLFMRLAALLGQELSGRSLMPGERLGEGLAGLRKRRALGRRAVADMAGVSTPTVVAIERDGNVRLASLVAVSVALSAGLRLSPTGTLPTYWSGAAVSSAHDGWTTPPEILDRLYEVIGGDFSLDPCSPTRDRRSAPVRAQVHLTLADDGLSHDWHGRVFCNPLTAGRSGGGRRCAGRRWSTGRRTWSSRCFLPASTPPGGITTSPGTRMFSCFGVGWRSEAV